MFHKTTTTRTKQTRISFGVLEEGRLPRWLHCGSLDLPSPQRDLSTESQSISLLTLAHHHQHHFALKLAEADTARLFSKYKTSLLILFCLS